MNLYSLKLISSPGRTADELKQVLLSVCRNQGSKVQPALQEY